MNAFNQIVLYILAGWLLVGCSTPVDVGREDGTPAPEEPVGPVQAMTIETDKRVYAVHVDSTGQALVLSIDVAYTNQTDQTMYFVKCGHQPPAPMLQKREEEGWVNALANVCRLILTPPIEVAPGETYTQTVVMRSWLLPNVHPRFAVNTIPGTYRLAFQVADNWVANAGPDKLLPLEARVSNEFEISEE